MTPKYEITVTPNRFDARALPDILVRVDPPDSMMAAKLFGTVLRDVVRKQVSEHGGGPVKWYPVLLLAIMLLSASAFSQTLHVSSIHRATRNEKTYRTALNQNIITGVIGNEQYTLEQLAFWGYYHFKVGADYPVVKLTDGTIKVRVADKKGHESTESLNVVGVSEK